jgi:molecular chaperone DnaJ
MILQLFRGFRGSACSWAKKSLYRILGVPRTANEKEIKQAYFTLAKQFHPDVNKSPNAKVLFSEISSAYETLGSPEKRQEYDLTGLTADDQVQMQDSPYDQNFHNFSFNNFDDLISDLQDIFKEKPSKRKGKDITLNLQLDFLETVSGTVKHVKVSRKDFCKSCNGNKFKNTKDKKNRCRVCSGRGMVLMDFGFARFEQICEKCHGSGLGQKCKCQNCKGSGMAIMVSDEIVKVPPGIDSGFKLKVPNKGHQSESGGPQGDLYIKISVLSHQNFRRVGNDVLNDVYITLPQSVLGGIVEVNTLTGKLSLRVTPGTCSGAEIRLAGLGFPNFPKNLNEKGDLVYTVHVRTPKELNLKQRKLYEELAEKN